MALEIKKQGGKVILNHPYKQHDLSKVDFSLVDYIEAYNARLAPMENEKALQLAQKHGIPVLAGSDAHLYAEIGHGITAVSYTHLDVYKRQILTKESVETMTKCVKNALPLGWMNTNDQGDWWRSGTLAGTSAMLKRQRDGFCWAFITNTSNWTGPRFPHKIEGMMARAMDRVKEWPDRNLFDPDYCKAFEDEKKLLANEKRVQIHPEHPDNI